MISETGAAESSWGSSSYKSAAKIAALAARAAKITAAAKIAVEKYNSSSLVAQIAVERERAAKI